MRLAGLLALAALIGGCALWDHEPAPPGPDDVPPELRLPLRLSVVGLRATMLLIYGGPERDVFLGCLTCERDARESIFNPEGPFGSTSAERSIWNPRSPYGDKHSALSPWNPHASCPPVLKDEYDETHGYFTANPKYPDRTRDPATLRFLKLWSER